MDKESKIFIVVLIFACCCFLFDLFGSMYIIHDMQHQIDELTIQNLKQELRLKILERIYMSIKNTNSLT